MERLAATYHSVISLILAMGDLAAADKKRIMAISQNTFWLKAWRQNEELKKAVLKEHSGWEGRMDKVRGCFGMFSRRKRPIKNLSMQKILMKNHKKTFIKHLSRKIILGVARSMTIFDEQNIRWTEDKDIIKSMMDKTIKSYAEGKITLQKGFA